MTKAISAILTRLVGTLEPYHFAPPWSALEPDRYYRGVSDPTASLSMLMQEFGASELVESQLVQQCNEGPILNPAVIGPPKLILPLYEPNLNDVAVLMTESASLPEGRITAAELPLLGADTGVPKPVFVTETFEEWALLHHFGLSAIPIGAVSLEQLSATGLHQNGGLGPSGESAPEFILTMWRPLQLSLDRPTSLASIAQSLAETDAAPKPLGAGPGIWLPDPAVLEAMRDAIRSGNPMAAGDRLQLSSRNDLFSLDALEHPEISSLPAGPGYKLARDRLAAELMAPPTDQDEKRLTRLQQDYNLAVEQELIAPMLAEALSKRDPHERSSGVILAELSRAAHQQTPLIGCERAGGNVSVGELNKILGMMNQIRRQAGYA